MGAQHEIKDLLSEYNSNMRKVEIISLISSALLFLAILYRLFISPDNNYFLTALCIGSGFVLADFFAGIVHWFADTWGSVHWPVVGPTLIRSFREHHVDQNAITRHDFVETNGSSALAVLPLLLTAIFYQPTTQLAIFFVGTAAWLCAFIVFTNQFHKWAHTSKNSQFVSLLQNSQIILPRKHHARHHAGKFDRDYCITSGWLNPLLNKIGFFSGLEYLVSRMTGAIPREEDAKFTELF